MIAIPRKLRRIAKLLAERVGPSYNAPGFTKQDVMNDRAKIRDAYLQGYSDAAEAFLANLEEVYVRSDLRRPEMRRSEMLRLMAKKPVIADHDCENGGGECNHPDCQEV